MNKYLIKTISFLVNLTSHFSSKFAAKLAIELFSRPQKGVVKKHESEFLETALQEEVIYENRSITTYHWAGKKDTILLAHGWESNSFRWKDLIEILNKLDYNIIALDAPAHGNSSGKLFNALLYSECINIVAKKFNTNVIIGHSVGGMATIFSIHKHKLSSIKKLILLGSPADFKGVFNRYTQMMDYNTRVSTAMNQLVLKRYNHLPDYFSAANFSKEIIAKGLIIHDRKDRIIPYTDALNFQKNYSNSKLITTKGFGHGLKSSKVYNYILEFLNT